MESPDPDPTQSHPGEQSPSARAQTLALRKREGDEKTHLSPIAIAPAPDPAATSDRSDGLAMPLKYLAAVGLVSGALVATIALLRILDGSISPIFFVAVMLSGWYGGLGPGLVSTLLAGWCCAYFFPNPATHIIYGWDDLVRALSFLLVTLVIHTLTSRQRLTEAALRRSRDELEKRVAERTAELSASNVRLKESEERFRLLVDGVADYAIVMLDADGRVVSWNPGAQRIFGYAPAEILGRDSGCFFPPDVAGYSGSATGAQDTGSAGRAADNAAGATDAAGKPRGAAINAGNATDAGDAGGASGNAPNDAGSAGSVEGAGKAALRIAAESGRHEEEGRRVRRDGKTLWANVITTALRDESGRLRGFAQITRDVSELRGLEREVLTISEAEQRRIGHDLHDDLGQQLTGLAFLSQNLFRKLAAQRLPEAAEADRIASLIKDCIEQTRELARGFAPVELGPDGLRTALAELCEHVSELSAMKCQFTFARDAVLEDDNAALHLYRIAREAVNNAVRHSGGKRIDVNLSRSGGMIVLSVADDGAGPHPPEGRRAAGMGINLMRYRARTIGADLEISAGAEGGTRVVCKCPGGNSQVVPDAAGRAETAVARPTLVPMS
jgi:signal transduction histidine kinase